MCSRSTFLSDIDKDNFDCVFNLIHPSMSPHAHLLTLLMSPPAVIQGTVDMGKVLMENKVQKMMDFLKNMLVPIDPTMQMAVAS